MRNFILSDALNRCRIITLACQRTDGNPRLIAFLLGFCGRLFGLWLVAWDILATPFDPVWPMECILADHWL